MSMFTPAPTNDEALVLVGHAVVKALANRKFSVGVSKEQVDLEGDIVTQKALLDSASYFLSKGGVLDLNHLSEVGSRYGISNPKDYIIGKATKVIDTGNGTTAIEGEILPEGASQQADGFWKSLSAGEEWRSSIYGFPTNGGCLDVRYAKSLEYPTATRYVIKEIRWESLALTKTPVCDAITQGAQIIKAQNFMQGLRRIGQWPETEKANSSYTPISPMPLYPPRNRDELVGQYLTHIEKDCFCCDSVDGLGKSVAGFREHFINCCYCGYDEADLYANALMNLVRKR